MNSSLRVLIVEDCEDDMLLILRELRRGGYDVHHVRVETPNTLQDALEQHAWDIVISDYTMPAFNALDALKILQSKRLDLPFLIVSGTIGEETAVAAMKAGAQDYLLKGNLARLVPAVERELRESEERQKRHSAEQALAISEDRFKTLCASAPLGIFHCDARGKNVYVNPRWQEISGLSIEESLGDVWLQAIHPDDRDSAIESWQRTVSQRESWVSEHRLLTPQGEVRWVRTLVSPMYSTQGQFLGHVGTAEDITEKKQLEAQFLRAQRLESLGTMASGIAHDLNNVLTPILGIVELLPLKVPDMDEQTQQLIEILGTNTHRGADLVKQILSFTRGVEGKPTNTQVSHLLWEIHKIIRQTFPKTIEVSTELPQDLWQIAADATALHQVFMNLCVNARDAMPNGGTLYITAENLEIDEHYARMHLDAQVGSYVVVTIADTGTGIPPKILDRIFDPFFTTKEIGKGTGLGLSTVLGIVKSHRGSIDVHSELGKGTQFKVYLPATETAEEEAVVNTEPPLGRGELILVVDDEVAVQEITQATLEAYCYKVVTANNGIEAIALYAERKDEISVVLIDLMMPELDSITAIRTLRKLNPQVQIIAMSGLVTHESVAKTMREGIQAFLAKPFTAPELLNLLPQLCDPKKSSSVQ
ncbi:response regulator [Altericista sp. CCNU0014]|uniref:hybrid sensor histidine kinase/response regulator n=1 Tax=Altericista sp. CCNU0014 TaxID=3082949 RepID=UPI00384ACB5E